MVVDVGAKNDPNPANRKIEYIPGELCEVVPGQLFLGRLSFTRSPEIINFACKTPAENATTIIQSGRPLFGLENQTDGLVCQLHRTPVKSISAPRLIELT
jgi:hypothetical protein